MEARCSSEKSVNLDYSTLHQILEGSILKGMRIVEMSSISFYLPYRDLFNDAASIQRSIASNDTTVMNWTRSGCILTQALLQQLFHVSEENHE
jgi:hypothetical protein